MISPRPCLSLGVIDLQGCCCSVLCSSLATDPNTWTVCRSDFAALRRDGYVTDPDPANDELDLQNATRIEFELRLFRDALGNIPTPLRFDIELAAISLF